MNASSLVHACEKPWATVRMAQLCSVMRQLPSGEPLRLGQVAVLVEDRGQRGDLLVEGEVRRPGQRAGDPPLAPLLEELVDLARARSAQVAEELGREVAVALRVERLGRRGQLVDVAGPAPARPSAEPRRGATSSPSSSRWVSWSRMAAGVRASASATAAASRGPWRFSRLRMAAPRGRQLLQRRLGLGGRGGCSGVALTAG